MGGCDQGVVTEVNNEIAKTLRNHLLFHGMNLKAIFDEGIKFELEIYYKRENLWLGGDLSDCFVYYVLSVDNCVFIKQRNGEKNSVVDCAVAGRLLGAEGVLFSAVRRGYTLQTLNSTTTKLLKISAHDLRKMLADSVFSRNCAAQFYQSVGDSYGGKLVQGANTMGRLCYTLLDLIKKGVAKPFSPNTYMLKGLSNTELSGLVGCSRERLGKLLKEFVRLEFVEKCGFEIHILKPAALQSMMGKHGVKVEGIFDYQM